MAKLILNNIQGKKYGTYADYSSTVVCTLLSSLSSQAQGFENCSSKLLCKYASRVCQSRKVLSGIEAQMKSISQKFSVLLKCSNLTLVKTLLFAAQVKCVSNIVGIQEIFLVAFEVKSTKISRPIKARFVLLEQVFATTSHPSLEIKKQLSKTCGLTIDQINNWFTIHRYRLRRKHQELTECQLLRYLDF